MTRLNLAAATFCLFTVFNIHAEEEQTASAMQPPTPPAVPDAESNANWNADAVRLDQETNTVLLEGNAVFSRGGLTVHADKMSIVREKDLVKFSGHVRIEEVSSADEAELNLGTGKVTVVARDDLDGLPIAAIQVRGLTHIKEADTLALIKTKVGQPFDRKTWDEDFHRLYDSGWFLNVRTTEPVVANAKATIVLDLTEKAQISKISIEGNSTLKSADILQAMTSHEGGRFDPGEIHKDKTKIEQLYEDRKISAKADYTVKAVRTHHKTVAETDIEVQDDVSIAIKIEESK